jgi:hypothetical protein
LQPEGRGMSETKRTKNIAFRLTDDEYAKVEEAALASDEDPNSWCRKLVLSGSNSGCGLTKNERLIYEEIARVRYLVGNGFRMLFLSEDSTTAEWKKITAQADQRSEKIADGLLARRQ